MMFQKSALFPFSGKKPSNLVYSETEMFSTVVHHTHSSFLRRAPESKSGPWVVTGKWLLENKKLTTGVN